MESLQREVVAKVIARCKSSEHSKDCIRFMLGECPDIPSNLDRCDYFLRFSSKISGHLTTPAESYIRNLYKIAKKHFGSRVHFWHEMNETGDEQEWGYNDWQEIHEAREKLMDVETGQEGDIQNHVLREREETTD